MNIIIIHGLNNTIEVFKPLGNEFVNLGHKVFYISLSGHDAVIETELSWEKEVIHLKEQLTKLNQEEEYFVIGFSQGALVWQNAISENLIKFKIIGQVLLAPALKIHYQNSLKWITNKIDPKILTPSRTPKDVSQFNLLPTSYYRILFEELDLFNNANITKLNEIPTLIIIDPDDELVSLQKTREFIYTKKMSNWEILPFPRKIPNEKKVFSKHHTLFFPTYFQEKDWFKLIKTINERIKGNTNESKT